MSRLIASLLWLILPTISWAQAEETIVVDKGNLEIPIQRYHAFGDNTPILLWLPSSRGTSLKQAITATALADIDVETWVVDLHLAYFVDAGRNSIEHFKAQDIAELIQTASQQTSNKIYLLSTDSGAVPTLEGIALAQQQAAELNKQSNIGGAILFHPSLTLRPNLPGTRAEYRSIAKNSTVPVYYIQPSISTKQWLSQEIVNVLRSGGSNVFFHPIKGVAAGFHLRPDDDLSDTDIAQREALPELLKQAIHLLSLQTAPPPPKMYESAQIRPANKHRFGLNQLKGEAARPLKLQNLEAQTIPFNYAEQKLSLISFWASWCEPCIKELPALARLQHDYSRKGLQITTINVGESVAEIEKAIERFEMSPYLNLRDPQGETMKDWNVYGFPSNFLINGAGKMHYGSFGAVEWDEPEVRQKIDALLANNSHQLQ